jgi:O6-methylguanine-DNA--protein-cysteine methyltransferase
VAASGQVAGFAGGKEAKAHLLSHESRQTREEANRF